MKKLILTILLSVGMIRQPTISDVYIDNFNTFSEFTLKRLIYLLQIDHPEIVFIQAQIESGHFNSKIFKEGNNLFGMKLPERRPTVAIGKHRGHAKYNSWQASVIDYKIMQDKYAKNKTRDEYLKYLRRYAEDPNYVRKIKNRL